MTAYFACVAVLAVLVGCSSQPFAQWHPKLISLTALRSLLQEGAIKTRIIAVLGEEGRLGGTVDHIDTHPVTRDASVWIYLIQLPAADRRVLACSDEIKIPESELYALTMMFEDNTLAMARIQIPRMIPGVEERIKLDAYSDPDAHLYFPEFAPLTSVELEQMKPDRDAYLQTIKTIDRIDIFYQPNSRLPATTIVVKDPKRVEIIKKLLSDKAITARMTPAEISFEMQLDAYSEGVRLFHLVFLSRTTFELFEPHNQVIAGSYTVPNSWYSRWLALCKGWTLQTANQTTVKTQDDVDR